MRKMEGKDEKEGKEGEGGVLTALTVEPSVR